VSITLPRFIVNPDHSIGFNASPTRPEVRRQVVIAAHVTIFTRHFGAAARGPVLPNPNSGVAVGVQSIPR
jgi:hypothetical protein